MKKVVPIDDWAWESLLDLSFSQGGIAGQKTSTCCPVQGKYVYMYMFISDKSITIVNGKPAVFAFLMICSYVDGSKQKSLVNINFWNKSH